MNSKYTDKTNIATSLGSSSEKLEAFNNLIVSLGKAAQLTRNWNIDTNISAISNYLRTINSDNPYAEAAAQFWIINIFKMQFSKQQRSTIIRRI